MVNLERIGKSVESRVSVQKLEQYNMGGTQGDAILDPEIYNSLDPIELRQRLYDDIDYV